MLRFGIRGFLGCFCVGFALHWEKLMQMPVCIQALLKIFGNLLTRFQGFEFSIGFFKVKLFFWLGRYYLGVRNLSR